MLSLLPIPGAVVAWLTILGWHAEPWTGPDGSQQGPYHAWEVATFVALLGALTFVAGAFGSPIVAAVAATLATTAIFAADARGTDDSGLWVVGAVVTLIGTALGTTVVAAAAAAWSRRRQRASVR